MALSTIAVSTAFLAASHSSIPTPLLGLVGVRCTLWSTSQQLARCDV
jgi:hypothetical protein